MKRNGILGLQVSQILGKLFALLTMWHASNMFSWVISVHRGG